MRAVSRFSFIFRVLAAVSGAIFKSTAVTGVATLVSRITGLAREMVYAQMFGASAFMDAWLVAFKIPNFLRRLFAEGSFSQAFVPVISEYKLKRSQDEVRQLVDEVAGTFGVVLFVVTLIGVIAAPLIILAFAPGWHDEPDKWHLATSMLRWTFPYLFFISLTALFSGVLNSYGRFALPAFTQVIMNVVMIVVALWIAPHTENPGVTLAMGVFVSGLLQLAFQVPAVMQAGSVPLAALETGGRGRAAHRQTDAAGHLRFVGGAGQPAARYPDRDVPDHRQRVVAVLRRPPHGIPARRVQHRVGHRDPAGPVAASCRESNEHFTDTLDWALRLVILLVSPAAVAMLVFAGPLTATTFGYGAFTAHDVRMASYALMAYSWGLLGFSLVKVLAPGYFARQDTQHAGARRAHRARLQHGAERPAWCCRPLPGLPVSARPDRHVDLHLGGHQHHAAVARAGTRGVYKPRPGWGVLLARVVFANAVMAALLIWLGGDIAGWLAASPLERAARLAMCVVAGAAAYFAALFAGGMRLRHMRNATHNRHGIRSWNTGPEGQTSRRRHHRRQLRWHSPRPRRVDRPGLRARAQAESRP